MLPPTRAIPTLDQTLKKLSGRSVDPTRRGTLAEMATRALKAAWFHKWIVNLRLRPEEYGALVQVRLGNNNDTLQGVLRRQGRSTETS